MIRLIVATSLSVALLTTSLAAAEGDGTPTSPLTAGKSALAPGKAAGISKAQGETTTMWVLGIGALAAIGVFALTNNEKAGAMNQAQIAATTTT